MKLERFKNTKKNSIWGLLGKLVTLIFPFAVRTILIQKLGVEYLGLNGLFTSILSILSLTELGIGSAIVFSMYEPLAQNDEKKICALMNLYKKAYRYIGLAVLLVGLILVPFVPYLISGEVPNGIDIFVLYFIYLINSVISYWLFAYKNCLLQVHQRVDITSKIGIVLNTLMYASQIMVLLVFKNYYIYVIILPLFSILTNIVTAYFVNKMFPQYVCNGSISKKELNGMKKRVVGLMLTKLAYASRNAFDSIVISAFLGLEIVAIYNNYYYISNSISAILIIVISSMAAGIGNSLATESTEKNINDLRIINFLYMSISGFCYTCMIVLYQPFMKFWVGEKLIFPNKLMFLFAIYFLVEKSLNIIGQYFDSAGLWWQGKWKGLIEALANLVFNVILCCFFGVYGVIITTILTIIFIGFPLTASYTFKCKFKSSAKKYILEEYLYILIFILIGIISYYVCSFIPMGVEKNELLIEMIFRLLLNIVLTSLLYVIIFFRFNIFKKSYKWIKIHIKK